MVVKRLNKSLHISLYNSVIKDKLHNSMNSTKILYWKHMICCLEDGRDPKWEIGKLPYTFFLF